MADAKPASKAAKIAENDADLPPMDLMAKRNKRMNSEASVEHGRNFKPRPDDVFVSTYPKCGTTWVTHICHLLRSGGSMDFDEISVVVPWDILAYDCGQDLDADQVGNPRVFKSHEGANDIAKGCRYIHVCRDPIDALISLHRFLPAWAGISPDKIPIETFTKAVCGDLSHSGNIWNFFSTWWERRNDPNVLWICFEDLKDDLAGQVKLIANFMGVELTNELLSIVVEKSTFKYMEARSHQFDEHFVFGKVRDQMGFPAEYKFGDVEVSKVRKGGGTTGEGKAHLPDEMVTLLSTRWDSCLNARQGLQTYQDLRDAVSEMHKRMVNKSDRGK